MTRLYSTLNWCEFNELAVKGAGLPAVFIRNNSNFTTNDHVAIKSVLQCINTFYTKLPPGTSLFGIRDCVYEGGLMFFHTMELAEEFFSFFCTDLVRKSFLYAALYQPDGMLVSDNEEKL